MSRHFLPHPLQFITHSHLHVIIRHKKGNYHQLLIASLNKAQINVTNQKNLCLSCPFCFIILQQYLVQAVYRLFAGRPRYLGSIPDRGKSIASRLALRPTQSPIQCVPAAFSSSDSSPSSSFGVRIPWSYTSTPPFFFLIHW
jgi:hypothetical protein